MYPKREHVTMRVPLSRQALPQGQGRVKSHPFFRCYPPTNLSAQSQSLNLSDPALRKNPIFENVVLEETG